MELSIIIVNWNTRELLAQCLASIYAHPPKCELETWVVDNASSDGSALMVRERFSGVRLIENHENLGFARANNQAIQESTGIYLLFLNSDTIVRGDALSRLVDFMRKEPEAGVVGASLLNRDGTPQKSYATFPSFWFETAFAFGLDSRSAFSSWFYPQPDSKSDWVRSDCVAGAAFMLKRSTLDTVGFFDEKFFMYSEEIDLQFRVKKAGWGNYLLRSAHISHLGGASTRQLAPAMKAELFRSKVYYFRKHHSPTSAVSLHWIFKLGILGRILKHSWDGDVGKREMWKEALKLFEMNKPSLMISRYQPAGGLTAPPRSKL